MKRLLRLLALLIVAAGGFAAYRLAAPYRAFSGEVFLEIPRGSSSRVIARKLAGAGVVRSEWDFLLARALKRGRVLQAGEYRFEKPASPVEVFDRLARGDVFYYELVVPEGKNMFDIGAAVAELGLISAEKFVAAARDPSMVRDLDPRAPSLEGYLFPDTYRISRSITADRLCRLMTAKFRETWSGLGTKADVHDTVTLASLVEKEGKVAAERPQIASVFLNRLRIGMKLDCDPTTIYAALLSDRYRGTIYRSDLESDHPYNTYRHMGLPPGPIANPGLVSIRAALKPAESAAIFFVLKPDGSGAHEFTDNIAAHQKAVTRYRRGISR